MTLKKVLLLGAAVLALAALAAPASAPAASFQHEHEQITEPMSETFSGWVHAENTGGSFGCQMNGEMSIESDSAEVVSVEYSDAYYQCYNEYAWTKGGCELNLPATAEALPWKVEPLNNTYLSLDEFSVEAELFGSSPFCPSGHGFELHATEDLTIALVEAGRFSKMAIYGMVETPWGGLMELDGVLSVDNPNRFQLIN